MNTLSSLLYWILDKVAKDGKIHIDTTAESGADHDLYSAITGMSWQSAVIESGMLNMKKLFSRSLGILKQNQLVTGSVSDTTQSGGWVVLTYNGSNLLASQYDVISAGCDGVGRLIIPFVSGGIWYAEIATYNTGTLIPLANTSVTVTFTLRKKG